MDHAQELTFVLSIIAILVGSPVLIYAEYTGKVFAAVTKKDLINLVINGGGSSDFEISSVFNIPGPYIIRLIIRKARTHILPIVSRLPY